MLQQGKVFNKISRTYITNTNHGGMMEIINVCGKFPLIAEYNVEMQKRANNSSQLHVVDCISTEYIPNRLIRLPCTAEM